MFNFIDDSLDILRTKEQKEKKYEEKVIFGDDFLTPEERIKKYSKKVPDLKNKIYLNIMNIVEKERKKKEKQDKEFKELINYYAYKKYFPIENNYFGSKAKYEYNFNNNAPKLLDGLFNKMGNFFSDIIDSLKSKNVSENEINNIINMNNEESKIIRKENLE